MIEVQRPLFGIEISDVGAFLGLDCLTTGLPSSVCVAWCISVIDALYRLIKLHSTPHKQRMEACDLTR